MIRQQRFPLLLLGCLFFGMASSSVGQEEEIDREKVIKKLTEAIHKSLRSEFDAEARIAAKKHSDFFQLSEEQVASLANVVNESVEEHVKLYTELDVSNAMSTVFQRDLSSTFSVNGTEYVVDGEEKADPFGTVTVSASQGIVIFSIRYEGSSGSTLLGNGRKRFQPTESENWKAIFKDVPEGDFDRFAEVQRTERRDSAIEVIVSAMTIELRLSQTQQAEMGDWLKEICEDMPESNSIFLAVKNCIAKVPADTPPDFLSQEQDAIWPLIVERMRHR